MSVKDKVSEAINRSTLANIVAASVVVASTVYFIYSGDVEYLKWTAAAATGWLFKEAARK